MHRARKGRCAAQGVARRRALGPRGPFPPSQDGSNRAGLGRESVASVLRRKAIEWAWRRKAPRSTERRRKASGGWCSGIESASRKRTSAPVQSFDGRRLGSTRAVRLFTRAKGGGDLGRFVVDSSRDQAREGAQPTDGDKGRQTDRPRDGTTGRERPRAASEERMRRRSATIASVRKRMGCREARHSPVFATRKCGERCGAKATASKSTNVARRSPRRRVVMRS